MAETCRDSSFGDAIFQYFSWNRTGKTAAFPSNTSGRMCRHKEDDGKQANRKEKIKTFQPVSDDGYES